MFLLLSVFCGILFNYLLFISIINASKSDFRKDLLSNGLSIVQTKKMALKELYKDSENIIWKENNKEIMIGGRYYEVLDVRVSAGEATISFIEDARENELFSSYFSTKKQNDDVLFQLVKLMTGMNFEAHQFFDLNRYFSFDKIVPADENILILLRDLRFAKPPAPFRSI